MKHEELTKRIIACAMRVHNELGRGFPEVIYQRAFEIELQIEGLAYIREKEMVVYYHNQKIGSRKADFYIEDTIVTELKATSALDDGDLSQSLNYLHAFKKEIGLLFNFGARSLEFKRVHNNTGSYL
jgi:GxxExxY protein